MSVRSCLVVLSVSALISGCTDEPPVLRVDPALLGTIAEQEPVLLSSTVARTAVLRMPDSDWRVVGLSRPTLRNSARSTSVVLVELEVTNRTAAPLHVSHLPTLEFSNGDDVATAPPSLAARASLPLDARTDTLRAVEPGTAAKVAITYEIPRRARPAALVIHSLVLAGGTARIQL